MSEIKDGGPAFAAMAVGPAGDIYNQTGMTLRDWFACQVLAECWRKALKQQSVDNHINAIADRTAYWSYKIADAMLKEREK